MLKSSKKETESRLSIRTSIIVWLGGAVLGWVVAVLAVYTLLRAPDRVITNSETGPVQQAQHSPAYGGNPANLSAIEPAAGAATSTASSHSHKSTSDDIKAKP